MPEPIDRRTFLVRGVRAGAGIGIVAAAPGVLAACGSSGGSGTQASGQVGVSLAKPRRGGKLIFSVNTETDGFDPITSRWQQSGIMYARTVFDPLAVVGADGTVIPYLAESITPNSTFDQFSITVRPNVSFHDGETLDAAALSSHLNQYVHGLSGSSLNVIDTVSAVSNDTVLVTMKGPWPPFPVYLTTQVGFVASPRQENNPNGGLKPIGTGPFVFQEWVPNDHFTATRNPDYWRAGLPYLDEITYRPIVNSQSQVSSLRQGDVDMIQTNAAAELGDLKSDPSLVYLDDSHSRIGEPAVNMVLLNTQQPPLDDLRAREALAYATDVPRLIQVVYNGVGQPMSGPFQPGSQFYSQTGYPTYDLAKAKQLASDYQRDKGRAISVTYLGTNNPQDESQAQILQNMWGQAGITLHTETVDDSTQINNVLIGDYQVASWSNYAAPDPDANYIFWASKYVSPPGVVAINFSRLADPIIDAALTTGRTSSNPSVRRSAYRTVARQLAVQLPQLWFGETVWAVAAKPSVMNFANPTAPDGAKVLPLFTGEVWPAQIWVT